MLIVNINDVAIITDKNVDYRYIIHNISKCEAINLSESSVLEDRGYTSGLDKLNICVHCFSCT